MKLVVIQKVLIFESVLKINKLFEIKKNGWEDTEDDEVQMTRYGRRDTDDEVRKTRYR